MVGIGTNILCPEWDMLKKEEEVAIALPNDFPSIKLQFLEKFRSTVTTHSIPDQCLTGATLV